MKNKNNNHHHKTVHQRVEQLLRHRVLLVLMLASMFMGVLTVDPRLRNLFRDAYTQGFGWIGTYLHHEHPAHPHISTNILRAPTISGGNT